MRIALISSYTHPIALGLRYLSASLKAHGHQVEMFFMRSKRDTAEANFSPALLSELIQRVRKADLIGLSLMTNSFHRACVITDAIRESGVNEEEFFTKGSSGGTMISSGYTAVLEIIDEWYHPSLWNVYAFHCSDGDNFPHDNPQTLKAARELCKICNLFGYGEIKPTRSHWDNSSMLQVFKEMKENNFAAVKIESKKDVWPSFKSFLSKERQE